MADARAERIAENEGRFRAINERLRRELETAGVEAEPMEVVCECGHVDCRAAVMISADAYRAVREHPLRFIVLPGHEIPEVETVVEEHDPEYRVLEKPAEVADLLE
jgi:hypothetical protein